MIYFLRLYKIILLEMIREPIGLFWFILVPLILFVFFNYQSINDLSAELYIKIVPWYISYIPLNVSLYGFCMYLIGRRESGIIKSFISGKKSLLLLIISQISASITMASFSFMFFIVSTSLLLNLNPIDTILALLFPFLIATVVTMIGTLGFLALPLSYQTANNVMSVTFTIFLLLSILNKQTEATLIYFKYINPISVWSKFISIEGVFDLSILLYIFFLISVGLIGFYNFIINPVWNRQ